MPITIQATGFDSSSFDSLLSLSRAAGSALIVNLSALMGHGRKETHPWLFDKNNNRRVENLSEATGRIDRSQTREEGQQAGEPLDTEVALGEDFCASL